MFSEVVKCLLNNAQKVKTIPRVCQIKDLSPFIIAVMLQPCVYDPSKKSKDKFRIESFVVSRKKAESSNIDTLVSTSHLCSVIRRILTQHACIGNGKELCSILQQFTERKSVTQTDAVL